MRSSSFIRLLSFTCCACVVGACGSSSKPKDLVTPAAAKRVVRNYLDARPAAQVKLERGPLRRIDRIAELTRVGPESKFKATPGVIVVSHQSAYPLQFLASSSGRFKGRTVFGLTAFSKKSAKDPWKAAFDVALDRRRPPAFATDSDGFAKAVSRAQWSELVKTPDTLPKAWSVGRDRALRAAPGTAVAKPFVVAKILREDVRDTQRQIARDSTNNVRTSVRSAPLSLPIRPIAYRLRDGRAFIGFATATRSKVTIAKPQPGSFVRFKVRKAGRKRVGLTAPKSGGYRSITFKRYALWSAIVPLASASDRRIYMVGEFTGLVGFSAKRFRG